MEQSNIANLSKEQLAWALVEMAKLYQAKCERLHNIEKALGGCYDR